MLVNFSKLRTPLLVLTGLVALALWTLGPAATALAHEADDSAPGEWRLDDSEDDGLNGGGRGSGNGDDGGLNADPDTFEIDSWNRGSVIVVDPAVPEDLAPPRIWGQILALLLFFLR